jgi:hypothetical protein
MTTRTTQSFASPGTAVVVPVPPPAPPVVKDRGRYSFVSTTRGRF